MSKPATKRVIAAPRKLDCCVGVDVTRTADMNDADIVISAATGYKSGPFP